MPDNVPDNVPDTAPDSLLLQDIWSERIPSDEWERLRGFGPFATAGGVLPNADHAMVLGVYHHSELIGVWMAKDTVILEGLYLTEPYRHSFRAAKEITFGMMRVLQQAKVGEAITLIQNDYIAGLAKKVGFTKLEGTLHLLKLGGG